MAAPKASRAGVSLESAGGGETGTVRAIVDLETKVCAECGRWGGARNRRDRVTDAITLQQACGSASKAAPHHIFSNQMKPLKKYGFSRGPSRRRFPVEGQSEIAVYQRVRYN